MVNLIKASIGQFLSLQYLIRFFWDLRKLEDEEDPPVEDMAYGLLGGISVVASKDHFKPKANKIEPERT